MKLRRLGKTDLMVSEVGFGGEWLERHPKDHSVELIRYAHRQGINIIDCWMADPKSRDIIGEAAEECRQEWIIQGHIGSTWQNGQYVRTRDMKQVEPASEDITTLFDGYDTSLRGIDPEREELYRLCAERDVGITVMKGFFGGALLDAARSPFGTAFTPVQLIHYALTCAGASSVLCGFETAEQVDRAIAYETASMEEKDYASVIASAPLHAYRGQCTYCGHCSPCPKGIDIAMVNKFFDLAVRQDKVPDSLRAHYEGLAQTAADCIGCRACEGRCPFGVPVAERMKQARTLFGS